MQAVKKPLHSKENSRIMTIHDVNSSMEFSNCERTPAKMTPTPISKSKMTESAFRKHIEKINEMPVFINNEVKKDRVNMEEIKFLFDALRDITAEKPYYDDGDHEMLDIN